MAIGRLEVRGTINLNQFWPTGSSDADTTKILVNLSGDAFRFRAAPNIAYQTTQVFDNASVVGKAGRKKVIDNKNRITVRLQGIDAPELHYRPQSHLKASERSAKQSELYLRYNEDYRQYLAETGTVKLSELLKSSQQADLPCTLFSAVDEPHDVFDVYGRFVGDILVEIAGKVININTWCVEQGWAFPAFYNSMSAAEIQILLDATADAWNRQKGVWPYIADDVGRLDFTQRFRRPSEHPVWNAAEDLGTVVLPKLFRRLSTWEVNKKAKMFTGTFLKYLTEKRDQFHLLTEFLQQGPEAAETHFLHSYIDKSGFFYLWPEELVFREAASRLSIPGGGEIHW